MPSEWDRPHMRWTLRLEYVLSDRTALDAFRDWLVANSNPQPLELHFALLAYDRMSAQRNVQTAELARSIYQKYISLRTSSCCFSFIPHKIRQEVGASLKSTGSTFPDPRLFSSIVPYVDSFLRQQHEQFVCSEEFLEAFNRMNMNCEDSCDFSTERRRSGTSLKKPYLTAETLMKTRHDREHVLGESSLEKMYPTTSMPRPYVCHATTSQNDSAVSSSFSSDANGHRPTRLRCIREEHLRGNPTTFAIPRVEHHSKTDMMKFDHNTEEGRKVFAGILCKKLNRLQARRERNDETERQLRDIENRKCTTRELVSTSEAVHVVTCDDDDDVECYLERMREDSLKTSANRSPCHNALSPRQFSPEHDRRKAGCGTGDDLVGVRSTLISSYSPSSNQFAPPPLPYSFNTSGVYYKEIRSGNQTAPVYDSSGVESMAPSAFSDTSGGSRKTPLIAPMLATPRRTRRSLPSSGQLMTISYKGVDGVPVVAHVPASVRGMTLKEFRRHFSISSHANVQFFFKSTCEDGSAPYQLLLVNEDSANLPIFEGRITAELKQISPE